MIILFDLVRRIREEWRDISPTSEFVLCTQRQIDSYCDLKTWGIVMKQVVMVHYGCRSRFQSFCTASHWFCCRRFGETCHINRLSRRECGRKVFSMLSVRYLWPMGGVKREVLDPGQYEQRKGKVTRMILSGASGFMVQQLHTFGVAVTLTQMLTTHTHTHKILLSFLYCGSCDVKWGGGEIEAICTCLWHVGKAAQCKRREKSMNPA
jgi:hypothetical protein